MATASTLLGTLTVLALLAAAGPSAADDDDRMAEAWTDALGDQEPVLTEAQFAKLNNLAFQAAVTKVCEGYALDGEKFATALSEATSPAPDGMSAEDAEAWKTRSSCGSARPMASCSPRAMMTTTISARARRI